MVHLKIMHPWPQLPKLCNEVPVVGYVINFCMMKVICYTDSGQPVKVTFMLSLETG